MSLKELWDSLCKGSRDVFLTMMEVAKGEVDANYVETLENIRDLAITTAIVTELQHVMVSKSCTLTVRTTNEFNVS
jgi:hypothetical protein